MKWKVATLSAAAINALLATGAAASAAEQDDPGPVLASAHGVQVVVVSGSDNLLLQAPTGAAMTTRAELCGLRSRGFVGVRRLSVPGGDGALGAGDRAWGERVAGASSQSSGFPALVGARDGNELLAARKA
ncbi:hypothetical protein [Saccharopolyspora elongata]|uniref:hypothetical protein n=1 Tax=Saccharopolyspora elongata TaxID=2530387 RepID=UPI00104E9FB4|nr:hypothetical protein [Saccharopolyspora elongata]